MTENRSVNVIVGVLAVLALPALAVAIISLQKGSDNVDKIHRLEHQVHLLAAASGGATKNVGSRVGTIEGQVSSLETKATAAGTKQAKSEAAVRQLNVCVPEVQSELSGLEITVSGGSAFIKNGTNVSKSCFSTLYGTGG